MFDVGRSFGNQTTGMMIIIIIICLSTHDHQHCTSTHSTTTLVASIFSNSKEGQGQKILQQNERHTFLEKEGNENTKSA